MRTVGILRQAGVVSVFAGLCFGQSGPSTTVRAGQFAAGAPNQWFSVAPPVMISQGTPGIPFSAEMVSEHKQTLGDGTNITETHVQSKIYHDSQGRTRTEQFLQIPGRTMEFPAFVQISDPVAGYLYTLDAQRHTIRKMAFRPANASVAGNRIGVGNITVALTGKTATMMADPSMARLPTAQAGVVTPANTGNSTARPEILRESLGTQNIEGVQATGTRTTTVYPEGFFGNDRPLEMTSEAWMSPELKMPVLTTSSDPRYGETTMRMTDIVLAEPDPSLFEIPSDYQETEQGAMGGAISFDARSAPSK